MSFAQPMFVPAFSMIVSGPSKAGKTVFVTKMVKYVTELMEQPPVEILWCYSEIQPGYKDLLAIPNVKLIEGIPDMDALKTDKNRPKLLIFDDMMASFEKNSSLVTLFIRGCHHWNLSCIHIVQNLYFGGLRTARINTNYLVLFKNPADKSQINSLGRQVFPGKSKFFIDAFESATTEPHSYLLIDLTQTCPEILRLRCNIFPGEHTAVYVPKV